MNNIMKQEDAREIIAAADKTLKELGFIFTFVCGCHINDDEKSMGFPFLINFDEELFTEFLYKFLNMEEYKEIKEKLLSKFNFIETHDEMKDIVKFVKL